MAQLKLTFRCTTHTRITNSPPAHCSVADEEIERDGEMKEEESRQRELSWAEFFILNWKCQYFEPMISMYYLKLCLQHSQTNKNCIPAHWHHINRGRERQRGRKKNRKGERAAEYTSHSVRSWHIFAVTYEVHSSQEANRTRSSCADQQFNFN